MPIPDSLRAELRISSFEAASGGCIHDCYRVTIGGQPRFLKTNDASHADAFAAEADGLRALRGVGITAPEPLAHGAGYLLLEVLELNGKKDFAALGRMLASAHRKAGPRFGWPRDNYIGSTPQPNGWCDDWAEFWLERRMRPQFELANRNGFRVSLASLKLLENHKPQP